MKLRYILFFLYVPFIGFSQEKKLPNDIFQSIQERILFELNQSIVVGIIDKNGPQYYSFGTNKGIDGAPVDEHSIYEIGSISKVFTATLLANNIVKGKMSADDPISRYLPSSVKVPTYDGKAITLGNLSDHTSSLPRMPSNMNPADPTNPYADYSVEQMYSFLSSCELTREIGSQYEYSNLAVGLLGHILALKAGTSYEKLLEKNITGPLKMNETGITLTTEMKDHLATGHSMGIEVPNWDLPTLAGAGAIRSSVYDMLIFLSANLGLTENTLQQAMDLAHQPRHDKAGASSVGLGWHINKGSQGDIIWHNGATGGYTAFTGFVSETGTGVVVLTNSSSSIDDIGFHLLDPDTKLEEVKPQLATYLRKILDTEGMQALYEKYRSYKKGGLTTYEINESAINDLGYNYLNQQKTEEALAIFKINLMEFPTSANAFDSYAEALMKSGNNNDAITNYKKSLALNPGNTNAVDMLAKLGVVPDVPDAVVDEDILRSYMGSYELAPGFSIDISKRGTKLIGQATGQAKFELFPKSTTEFYLKVADAQITFSTNSEGEVSMTLYQNGQVLTGKKL